MSGPFMFHLTESFVLTGLDPVVPAPEAALLPIPAGTEKEDRPGIDRCGA